jgi:hypothetical protein
MFHKLLPAVSDRKIYAFEPSSWNFSALQDVILKNKAQDSMIPVNMALSDHD